MNNITPIRSHMMQQGGPPGWWWDGCGWQPQHPDCGCGPTPTPPSCFSQVAHANACYDQSQALYNLVSKVVTDIFTNNPGIIPSPPPASGSGPVMGVTDGSNAAPGQVGEFVTGTATFNYPASGTPTTTLSPLVVQPGDWDLYSYMTTSTDTGTGAYFQLNPLPVGVSNSMTGWYGVGGSTEPLSEFAFVIGLTARGSFSVPTLLAFQVGIGTPPAAGVATLVVSARRRR